MPQALVTGAGGGIGRVVVERLLADGFAVVAADLTAPEGVGSRSISIDVTDPASVRAAFEGLGSLDVLVTAAGVGGMAMTADLPKADWDRTIEVNLTGTFLTCQAALPLLIESKGSIVTIASSGGIRATPYNAAYCVSKAGVIMLTKVLATEHGKDGVRANAICPGSVKTPFLKSFMPPEGADMALLSRLAGPLPRLLEPIEVADAVGYLISDSAKSITGTTLVLDSGSTA